MNTQPTTSTFTTHKELAKSLYSGLFATKANLTEAYEYAVKIAEASDNPVAVLTAIGVFRNAVAQELLRMETNDE